MSGKFCYEVPTGVKPNKQYSYSYKIYHFLMYRMRHVRGEQKQQNAIMKNEQKHLLKSSSNNILANKVADFISYWISFSPPVRA